MQYKLLLTFLISILSFNAVKPGTIFVDVKNGKNTNPGTLELPLQTIGKAIEIINCTGAEDISNIKIASGLYTINNDCIIKNNTRYTDEKRLIIEALILPDDKRWKPEDMPVLVSIQNTPPDTGEKLIEISGLDVEVSHVTIRGLKFIGSVIPKVFYYPIYRKGDTLEDLVVSQCMFVSDPQVAASNVGIIANGHSVKIDHCVFYGCANAVVFWNAEGGISNKNSMTHCIIEGGYISAIWLCQTGEDLEFHNNIISNSGYAFMRSETNCKRYTISNCIITNNKYFSGMSTEKFELSETGNEISYLENNIVRKGNIRLEKCTGLDMGIPKDYLQIKKGTTGYELGAGIFRK